MKNEYIIESDKAIAKNLFGAVFGPTGVGKGVSIENVTKLVLDGNKKNLKINVIVAHRILLAQQLGERCVRSILKARGKVEIVRIAIHTGDLIEYGVDDALEKMILAEYPDKTPRSDDELENDLFEAARKGNDVLINVTYHSLDRLIRVLKKLRLRVDCSLLDEIQTIMGQKEWYDTCKELIALSDRAYGFTATPGKHRERIEKLFGKIIYEMDIYTAIRYGLITKPRWFVTSVDGDRMKHLSRAVTESFCEFSKISSLETKMLVHCKDSKDIAILGDKTTGKLLWDLKKIYSNLMIAEISSVRGHLINGALISNRVDWLNQIINHNDPLIVLHIDICNAGLDVPGFDFGLWTYVPGSETYTIQGNGRSGRLHSDDREKLLEGVITPNNRDNWIKPYNTIGIIDWIDSDGFERDRLIALIMRSREQGFDPEDIVYVNAQSSINKEDPFEGKHGQKNPINQSSLAVKISIAIEEDERQIKLRTIKNDKKGRISRLMALARSIENVSSDK